MAKRLTMTVAQEWPELDYMPARRSRHASGWTSIKEMQSELKKRFADRQPELIANGIRYREQFNAFGFAGIKFFIDQESSSFRCDTHLLNVLRRAAGDAWELAGNIEGAGLAARLTEARLDERERCAKIVDQYWREDPNGPAINIASAIRGKS